MSKETVETRGSKPSAFIEKIRGMAKGDEKSFPFDANEQKTLYVEANRSGKKFTTRRFGKLVRVWRLS